MPAYVITTPGAEAIEWVVRYSSPPPARVLDRIAARGWVAVLVRPPRALEQAQAIARDPTAWRVVGGEILPR